MPDPKLVVACGDCARDGGIYRGSYAVTDGVERVIPVDGYIPGCPPTPTAILLGLSKIIEAHTK
jgi:Ni,Fe-hydrogenase III small subunit